MRDDLSYAAIPFASLGSERVRACAGVCVCVVIESLMVAERPSIFHCGGPYLQLDGRAVGRTRERVTIY